MLKSSKNKSRQIDKQALIFSLDSNIDTISMTSTESIINETGKNRQEILDICLADSEVESCREDIEGAIVGKSWRIYAPLEQQGETAETDLNLLYAMIRKHIKTFASLAILAKFNGYAVAEYVFKQNEDGFIYLDKVLSKDGELDKYTPKRNGTIVYQGDNGEQTFDEHYQETKLLLITSKAVPARPMGEMMIIKAYPSVSLKRKAMAYAGQFLSRHAQPYIVGKTGGQLDKDKENFAKKLFGFMSGGATGIGKDDDINILQLSGSGEAFINIEQMANAQIQKLLLGRVKTSELSSGSRSAQETDDIARQDRIKGYLDIMTNAIQHAINATLIVNQAFGKNIHAPQGLLFEYTEQTDVDIERANRDKLYFDTGLITPTESYMTDIVGFEKGHIVMNDMPKTNEKDNKLSQQTFYFSEKKDDDDHLPNNDFTAEKVDKILALLDESQDYDEFQQKLSDLNFDNKNLIDDLAKQMISSYVKGLAGTTNKQGENQL